MLGPDADQPATGANRKDNALGDTAMAGWARRGFLKGLEINLGCAGRGAVAAPGPTLAPITADGPVIQAAAPVVAAGLHRVDESAAR